MLSEISVLTPALLPPRRSPRFSRPGLLLVDHRKPVWALRGPLALGTGAPAADFWDISSTSGLAAPLVAAKGLLSRRHRQRLKPPRDRPEQPPRQVSNLQNQPLIPRVLHESAARPDQPLLQTRQRPCIDRLLWCFAHIYFLIGCRNRLIVMMNWAWNFVTFQRGARLITGMVGAQIKDLKQEAACSHSKREVV